MTPDQAIVDALPRRISHPPLAWAGKTPDAPALREGDIEWSYARLGAAVRRMAERMAGLGVRGGDRVMLVGENGLALVTLMLAASELDAWPAIINARLSEREIDGIRDHCRPRRVFYTDAVSPDAAAHAVRHGAEPLGDPDLPPMAVGPLLEAEPEPVYPDNVRQVGALIYTSGTTGQPKGVMLSHRGLLFVAAISGRQRGLHGADRTYGVLPISHVFGVASTCLGTLYAGGCLHTVPRFDPKAVVRALEEDGVTVLQGVPAMYAKLVEHIHATGKPLNAPHLRYLSSGGSVLDLSLKRDVEATFGLTLHNGYGLTECSPTVTQTRLDSPRTDTSIGPPLPCVEVRFVDHATGWDVPSGEVGELWVRAPNVMLGYYRAPELTAQMLTPDGWLKTGDVARLEPDGCVSVVGRIREIIIHSGFNVYPEEVEGVLASHPAVTLAAVIGREVAGNEEVLAFVQLAPGQEVAEAELKAWAAERLAPYKRPARIVAVPALPASPTGKLKKGTLREMAEGLLARGMQEHKGGTNQ
ncbi:AMP-binding protein [Azospirillum sp. TSO22-1]|uniref:class I adenylate-forming enzyme family protein n=1 Tax=Azospirillum sp. TSO22-1 TaxID=716789 RepID=UPI000D610B9A|nr:AMP-binding protein [Azospirillum sp. TSO22-1]PWC52395.1 long-chain fatty acid--CoA ligase [Azospirillum sp. TSO22-1]